MSELRWTREGWLVVILGADAAAVAAVVVLLWAIIELLAERSAAAAAAAPDLENNLEYYDQYSARQDRCDRDYREQCHARESWYGPPVKSRWRRLPWLVRRK
jgi:hypothetical protein